MSKIKFDIIFGGGDATPMSAEAAVGYRRTAPNCPSCGRFCRMHSYQEYNGSFTIWYVDVKCSRCGEFTEQMT